MPAGFRKGLGTNPMMFVKDAPCIMVYPASDYVNIVQKRFTDVDVLDLEMEDKKRKIFSRSQEAEVDKQGRVLINKDLAKLVGLDHNLVSIGAMDHIEIWDEKTFDDYMATLDGKPKADKPKSDETEKADDGK